MMGKPLLMLTEILCCNPLYTGDSQMSPLANSEDPDEMLHNVVFLQSLHSLLRQKLSSDKKLNFKPREKT